MSKGSRLDLAEGSSLGGWRLTEPLKEARRGIGTEVWKAERGSEEGVLKILLSPSGYIAKRFREEQRIMEQEKGTPGIIPLLDGGEAPRPWFAMPLATALRDALPDDDETRVDDVARGVQEVASTLEGLHTRTTPIWHRDVKPDNILVHDGHWVLADFGIAREGEGSGLTSTERRLGPLNFVPWEALAPDGDIDWAAVDVYELGKTLWVLATGQSWPIPGFQPPNERWAQLGSYVSHPRLERLDYLICHSSFPAPNDRLSMAEFRTQLDLWLTPRATKMPTEIDEKLKAKLKAARDREHERNSQTRSFVDECERATELVHRHVTPVFERIRSETYVPAGLHKGGDSVAEHLGLRQTVAGAGFVCQRDNFTLIGGLAIERRSGEHEMVIHAAWVLRGSDGPIRTVAHEQFKARVGLPYEEAAIMEAIEYLDKNWPVAAAALLDEPER